MTSFLTQRLKALAERYARTRNVPMKTIAKQCGYSPSQFSLYVNGKRSIRSREVVLVLARGLELDRQETNELLVAAGFAPTGELELYLKDLTVEAVQQIHRAFREAGGRYLQSPDKDALSEMVENDIGRLMGGWLAYLKVREHLYHREWTAVSAGVDLGLDQWYRPLREAAAKYYAYLALLKVAADFHCGHLIEAMRTAESARAAAELANDPMILCRCYVRLADIYKASGRLKDAEHKYDEALKVIRAPKAKGDPGDGVPGSGDWSAHWEERINRKCATLKLVGGEARQAVGPLQDCIGRLKELGNMYELAQAYLALGWAYSNIGKWDSAVDAHSEALKLINEANSPKEWKDPLRLMEAYLCLASDHLHRREYVLAKQNLKLAEEQMANIGGQDTSTKEMAERYRDAGWLDLLLGKLYRDHGSAEGLELARSHFDRGLGFHLSQEIKTPHRLASLYNAYGLLYLKYEDRTKALEQFEKALCWADQSVPPNGYYKAAALVNICIVISKNEESEAEFQRRAKEAREACLVGSYYQDLARLETVLAKHHAQRHEFNQLMIHAAEAIIAATEFNQMAVDDVRAELEELVSGLPGKNLPGCKEMLSQEIESFAAGSGLTTEVIGQLELLRAGLKERLKW